MKKRELEKDLVMIILLVAIVLGSISFIKDMTITGAATANQAPIWTSDTATFTITKNSYLELNLNDYFTDPDGDELTFLASAASNIGIEVTGQTLLLTPDTEFTGERMLSIFASDEQETTRQIIRLEVLEVPGEITANDPIVDQQGHKVGKKIKEDKDFNTIIESVEKTESQIIIQFHHDGDTELPIKIEGKVQYTLSKKTALPAETITLKVQLVNGIVPKFKLHVGATSDIFEFGKSIPTIISDGNYEVYDREDDYVDIEITKGSSRIILNAVDAPLIKAKIGDLNQRTEVAAADPITIGAATITLAKRSPVSKILVCDDFNTEVFQCLGHWQETDIPFTDTGDSIIFTVSHFSAYTGGASTNLTIWDDSDLGTKYINNPIQFNANFTNATGPANTTNGACQIRFNTTGAWSAWNSMNYDAATQTYWNLTTFSTAGTPHYYQINCTGTGETLSATDSFYLYQFLPSQGLLSCNLRTGTGCLPGETDVLGLSATTNAHAELATQSNYNTRVCCQDNSGRNTIFANGTTFLNLSNFTNAHAALPNSSVPYNYSANISGSNDTLYCTFVNDPTAPGVCASPLACVVTLSNSTNAHVSDCTNNPYNWSVCCGFNPVPLPSNVTINKSISTNPAYIGSQITVTINYRNKGPGQALFVSINETYPNGTTYVSANPAPSIGNNYWNIGNLTPGQSGTITVRLRINNNVVNGTVLNNTVNLTWTNVSGSVFFTGARANTTAQRRPAAAGGGGGGGWPATEGMRQVLENEAVTETPGMPSCSERWTCGQWSECTDGQRTRTCIDHNGCGTEYFKPGETTGCITEQPAAGQAIETPPAAPEQVIAPVPEKPAEKKTNWIQYLPLATYSIIGLLIIVLMIYLIREHLYNKKSHDAWYYILYAFLALSLLSIAAESYFTREIPYPAIFAIAAVIMVFILDALLQMIGKPKTPAKPMQAEPKKKSPGMDDEQLDELSRKLEELKI